jgi:protein SCO1
MKTIRVSLWIAAVIAAIASGFLVWSSQNQDVTQVTAVQIGGPFTLTDQNGRTVTERDFADKARLVFFGFTFCPDVCPTTLARIAGLVQQLGRDGDKLHVLLISVDPERDTPAALKDYVEAFDKRFLGLTGTTQQISAAAKVFRIHYEKVATANGDYTMDHTSGILMFSASGAFKGLMKIEDTDERSLASLRSLIAAP